MYIYIYIYISWLHRALPMLHAADEESLDLADLAGAYDALEAGRPRRRDSPSLRPTRTLLRASNHAGTARHVPICQHSTVTSRAPRAKTLVVMRSGVRIARPQEGPWRSPLPPLGGREQGVLTWVARRAWRTA